MGRAPDTDGHEVVDHHTYTIASDGDLQEGVASEACSLAGPSRPRPPDRVLRRQPHLDRGRHRALVLARTSASASRPTAGTSRTSARTSTSAGSRPRSRRRSRVEDKPSLIIVRTHIAPGLAEQAGHRGGARRAARRGGGQAHQGGLRLADRRALPRARRGARALPRGHRPRARGSSRSGRSATTRGRSDNRELGADLERALRRELPEGWDKDLPQFEPRGRGHRHAQGVEQGHPVGGGAGAGARRRLGRPGAVDPDADRRRRQRRAR